MAFYFQKPSRPAIAQLLRQYSQSLSEKDRRRFAALAALTLGHGGSRSLAKVLGCAPQTLPDGMRERKQRPDDPAGRRVRKPGGGRHKTAVTQADVLQQRPDTLKHRTAGEPMRQEVGWTALTPPEMATSRQAHAIWAGPRLVRRLLAGLGFARRQRLTVWPGGDAPHRGVPCRHLAHVIHALLEAGHPVVRSDTKKKASWGRLSRDGKVDGQQALKACAPDCPRLATGVSIPPGIDALARHQGWRHGGRSRDTTACACDSLRLFGHGDGQRLYPHASAILLLCDGGGSNSCHKPRGKEDLPGVVNDIAVPIRVAHTPAYCSQGNPIERRLFSHVTRACQGVLFDSLQTVLGLMQKTNTPQGLTVTVRVLDQRYEGGRTVSEAFKQNMPIVFENLLPKWNYWALPQ